MNGPVPVRELATPCVLVDEERMDANLRRAGIYAEAQGVDLRPHAKTHKSPELARRQIARGATGVCVAKLGEAEAMAEGGVPDLFLAHTLVGEANARRAARLARRVRFAVGVDHPEQARFLAEGAETEGTTVEVMVEVDTGAGRGGVAPAGLPELVRTLREAPGLSLRGLYSYEGYTYNAADREALRARHLEAQRELRDAARGVEGAFPAPPLLSMGSTPSLLAEVELLPEIGEIRAGTSIYLDAAQAALAGGVEHCAAHVLATVVSRTADRAILDAGSKSLTSDTRAAGVCATRGHGRIDGTDLTLARLSEEHGVVEGAGVQALQVGQRVRIVPNHICPVINLFDRVHLTRDGLQATELPVAARGRVA